jgi:hypothetical protein
MIIAATKNLNFLVLGKGVGMPRARDDLTVRRQRMMAAIEKAMLPAAWHTIPASYSQI